ncbi:Transglutaminase-like enzyme, putative cysteine protease [Paracoccus isoporae]|uniref:Transglutaminase-like enzyme, putative cysteine protease n=1 Tax=Paracoccus isoporae TaxID=591205 RepID=A0A1G7E7J0_9RHOB|nr:transglutaminase family protein [Paracoccus isoporae]SDE59623.1 Transglutaminase-like enzyme, putative cysteine protease [Paracoccus isoporae]
MRLRITHHTVYDYERPVSFGVQSLRVTPSVFEGQKVIDWQVDMGDTSEAGAGYRDGAGDWVQLWTIHGPISKVPVRIEGEVVTTDLAGVLRGHREVIHPMVYLQTTKMTEPDEALRDLAAGPEQGLGDLDLAHALSHLVHEKVAYRTGVTNGLSTAAEVLAAGGGVCQDHAHVLMAVARARGLPARYVSGYLHADAEGNIHEAAHAWAEIHVGGLGWVGFDAANATCPNDLYVRTGSGLDSRDAAPIRGVTAMGGAEKLEVTVAVSRVEA